MFFLYFSLWFAGVLCGVAFDIIRTRSKIHPGQPLYLSADDYEMARLNRGQLSNVRASTKRETAEKAHGSMGIEAKIQKYF